MADLYEDYESVKERRKDGLPSLFRYQYNTFREKTQSFCAEFTTTNPDPRPGAARQAPVPVDQLNRAAEAQAAGPQFGPDFREEDFHWG